MNDKLKPLHDEDFEQWLKRTQASNLSSISKVAYLFIALEQLDTARTAFINIQNFIRDHNGSSWDGVRSFCKAALAKIGAGQVGPTDKDRCAKHGKPVLKDIMPGDLCNDCLDEVENFGSGQKGGE